jgi:hypothetical protein
MNHPCSLRCTGHREAQSRGTDQQNKNPPCINDTAKVNASETKDKKLE